MFGKPFVRTLISRSAENRTDRRRFLKAAGAAGLGVVGATYLGVQATSSASATGEAAAAAEAPSDAAVLNFALNLEYLEAEFYSFAVHGRGLPDDLTGGVGAQGGVVGGKKVMFHDKTLHQFAKEIAGDEVAHVEFLRGALGEAAVSRPEIDLKDSFTAAARAAGLIGEYQQFDPFANEKNFLLAAFLFEDVGVTAYKGAAPLITNKTFLDAAAGILAAEAYHAATIRTSLFDRGLGDAAAKISNARDALDGPGDDDQGILLGNQANIVPTDDNGICFGRGADRVLNVVYLNPGPVKEGGFFPKGVNGDIVASGGA
ncbi:ferritin-like domain-containing protein [Amycolatopsis sp. NPDC057786]|uniref:ferritin-like domain-containing protein n=1 Tax=Amycolatopsis sp. NPDC057786 TaxID=3346250 RepID=UPI0036728966